MTWFLLSLTHEDWSFIDFCHKLLSHVWHPRIVNVMSRSFIVHSFLCFITRLQILCHNSYFHNDQPILWWVHRSIQSFPSTTLSRCSQNFLTDSVDEALVTLLFHMKLLELLNLWNGDSDFQSKLSQPHACCRADIRYSITLISPIRHGEGKESRLRLGFMAASKQ